MPNYTPSNRRTSVAQGEDVSLEEGTVRKMDYKVLLLRVVKRTDIRYEPLVGDNNRRRP